MLAKLQTFALVGIEGVPVEVEVTEGQQAGGRLAAELEAAIRSRLNFRARVSLIGEGTFGDSAYKTNLTRPS